MHQNNFKRNFLDQEQVLLAVSSSRQFNGPRKGVTNEILSEMPKSFLGSNEYLEKCLTIMRKHIKTINEIQILANYLSQLDDLSSLLESSNKNCREILVLTSCALRHEFTSKSRIILKYGKIKLIQVIRVLNTILF